MAKQKFPGKALKLNQRDRVSFTKAEDTPECQRISDIKKGLQLFRSIFGDSDEDSFDGFEDVDPHVKSKPPNRPSKQNGCISSSRKSSPDRRSNIVNGTRDSDESSSESNEFSQTIALYADSVADESDRLLDEQSSNVAGGTRLISNTSLSPKREKAKRKIEKILRSQWDERLKNKEVIKPGVDAAVCSSKNILREPRLNLNNETLLKIRTPVSSQNAAVTYEEDQSGRCSFCCNQSTKLATVYGVSCCDSCSQFLTKIAAEKNVLVCLGGHGGCQLVGLPCTARCRACWLLKVFMSCSIPVLVHDKLRKLLPNGLREKIPTSLAQECPGGINGKRETASFVDLPGGWKRRTDGEIVVISPSGDTFRDLNQLGEYMKNNGIKADPIVMFGAAYKLAQENRIHASPSLQKAGQSKVVTTNLPGGWCRITKWDGNGSLVETIVSSPDGKTFSSSKDLYYHFQCIGKVDDMNKYFPLEEPPNSVSTQEAQPVEKSASKKKKKHKKHKTSINLLNFSDGSEDPLEPKTAESLEIKKRKKYKKNRTSINLSDFSEEFSEVNVSNDIESPKKRTFKESPSANTPNESKDMEYASEIEPMNHPRTNKIKSIRKKEALPDVADVCETTESLTDLETSDSTVINLSELSSQKRAIQKNHTKKTKMHIKKSFPDLLEISSDPDSPFYTPICEMLFPSGKEKQEDFLGFGESKIMALPPKKIKSKFIPKLHKSITKEKLKDDWLRKIKWTEKGEGKVMCITSPGGQRFKSSIELMAYFKKSGLPHADANYYFPKELQQDKILEQIEPECLSTAANDSKKVKSKVKVLKPQATGPRVKNVCRTQAQVLGKPLATFSKKSHKLDSSINNLSPGEKILKKTVWCGKCSGCSRPNCRKCIHCLDMKKYGGPGCKKKPCLLRKCSNPRLSFKTKIIPCESSSNLESSCNYSSENLSEEQDKKEESWIRTAISRTPSSHVNKNWDSSVVQAKTIFPKQPPEEPTKTPATCKLDIDHWSDDVSKGLPVIVTEPLDIPLCFQCGSAGVETLLYCSVCCEGYHPFCLDEGAGPQSEYEELFWVCQRCVRCHVCGDFSKDLMQCASCGKSYHLFCIQPQDHRFCPDFEIPWLCGSCSKCISCGSPNVADFSKWPITEESEVSAPFCNKCLVLHNKLDFCPVCFGCYDEEDFSLKMMECSSCNRWIHSQCEGISDDLYHILSQLEKVDYVCCLCSERSEAWIAPIHEKLNSNFKSLIDGLLEDGFNKDRMTVQSSLTHKTKCLNRNRPFELPPQQVVTSTPVKNHVPRVCKEIDDDCVSSEESNCSDTDSDLESLDEDEDPKCFEEVLSKFNRGCYKTLLEAHVDISRVIRKDCPKELFDECKKTYEKHLSDLFSWFKPSEQNIFDIVDRKTVVPIPSKDHEYLLSKDSMRQCNSKYWNLLRKNVKVKPTLTDSRKCVFCGTLGDSASEDAGRLLYHGQDEWVHVNCSLWSSEVYENEHGCLQNITTAVTRGKQIKCSWCDEKGATVGCCHKSCGVTYHLSCARESRCVFMKDRSVFCYEHGDTKEDVLTDFSVNRRILIDVQSERKRWKKANDWEVGVNVGSLRVSQLGSIFPGAETESAMYPNGYICSRLYWSTFNPLKRVWYTCRIKVVPQNSQEVLQSLTEYNDTIDYTGDPAVARAKTLKMNEWHAQLKKQLPRNNDSTRVVPPHLCPMYQNILERERKVVDIPQVTAIENESIGAEEDNETRKICKVIPMTKDRSGNVKSKTSLKYWKRNYKTVIKNYSSPAQSEPINTFQIEINETIEMPEKTKKKRKLRHQFSTVLDTDSGFTSTKENHSSNINETPKISKNVVQISNHMNNITVSIVDNNDVRSKRRKRSRRPRNTLLQVDGAAHVSSSEDEPGVINRQNSSLIHHIKQQSLARSVPGSEGPLKCTKCKRSYRTKDSFLKHSETCNFEVDSSSSSSEDVSDHNPQMAPTIISPNTPAAATLMDSPSKEPSLDRVSVKRPLSGVVQYPAAKRTHNPRRYINKNRGFTLNRNSASKVQPQTSQSVACPTLVPSVPIVPEPQAASGFQPATFADMGIHYDTRIQQPQMATVVSGASVALPAGYTLQYVGSFRGDQMNSANNVMTPYNPLVVQQPMVLAQAPVAPQMVLPQVYDNTYSVAATNGFVYSQPAPITSVQYVQQPAPVAVQNIVQQPIMIQQNTFEPALSAPIQIVPSGNAYTVTSVTPQTQIISTPSQILPMPAASQHQIVPTSLSAQKEIVSTCVSTQSPVVSTQSENVPTSHVPTLLERNTKPKTYVRPIFSKTTTQRSVATVAPAVYTPTVSQSKPTCSIANGAKPRPTYSYRDAMKGPGESTSPDAKNVTSPPSENLQSFKIRLKKDRDSFSMCPLSNSKMLLSSPEVKEVRIKAKVSVGPKKKKHRLPTEDRQKFIADRDINKDPYANEVEPNRSLNLCYTNNDDLREHPSTSSEPKIVFELTAEDGFHVESKYISDVWQKVFDAVAEAREAVKIGNQPTSGGSAQAKAHLSGFEMLGLTNNAVKYLLEQLPNAKQCHKYAFQFQQQPEQEKWSRLNPSGCIRAEPFKKRRPYDLFSWLASKHRRIPDKSTSVQDECLPLSRRATSLELPMAMRYRHLCETAREAVGVFRSEIHGRGLFCKRDIEAGEMVIEYAGQVIRSSLCDIRERRYEAKGIGCYMFRIDEKTVVDATLNGNAARFINHSCDPNCFSRVVDVLGKKHILIFALRKIIRSEELTYDYKFPIEDDKIPCSCGSRRCRKYLN